jgi:hypothetical protein
MLAISTGLRQTACRAGRDLTNALQHDAFQLAFANLRRGQQSIQRKSGLEAYGCRFKVSRLPQRVVEHPYSDYPVKTLALVL